MVNIVNSEVVIEAAVAAATLYADLITDHDPGESENHIVPRQLREFLARLRLLHGVPFSYLVPDADLLPIESIRFFYVDRAWTDALVQGALGVGTITTADRAQLEAVYPHIRDEVDVMERNVRAAERGPPLLEAGGTITGFLMRSRAVSGWPNLHVRAYLRDVLEDDALTTEAESHPQRMKVLRMERLAPAVLLVLLDGVPAVVHIEEPRQGIQFGVRFDPDAPPALRRAKVKVRDALTGNPKPPKEDFTPENSVDVPFRRNAPGVINMAELRKRLLAKADHVGDTLEPHEYALQMLRFPYRQVFGDPDDLEDLKFYDIDQFKAAISLSSWKDTIAANVDKVTP